MRYPGEWYQLHDTLQEAFGPTLRPAHLRGLAWWVYGTILAHSACQTAVLAALLRLGPYHAWRQYLREWLYDGADKAAPCQCELAVAPCFAPLLGWLLRWWQGDSLPLAIDATSHGDHLVALVVSVLYRGSAIPVAWHILPANQPGPWLDPILDLLVQLQPAVPRELPVLVLTDRGLWSPRLWRTIQRLGWHPLLRIQERSTFQPTGGRRVPVRTLVPGPGHAWVGAGVAFKHATVRQVGTLLVVWEHEQAQPWVLLTSLAPAQVGLARYGLRVWIELGFRVLKSVGWQWQRTRRHEPARVARHWLVLAVATLWTLAYGTRVEDAAWLGRAPAQLHTPPRGARGPARQRRTISVLRQGWARFSWQLARGRLWTRLWLRPEPWPAPSPALCITYHQPP